MRLLRHDARAERICAALPFRVNSPARLVPGARWDAEWQPTPGAPLQKVWHWPLVALPVLLRTFPDVATDDPHLAAALGRARRVNEVRAASMEHARSLAQRFDLIALPRTVEGKCLRQHQVAGVRLALANGGSRGLFHETGTGKTITAGTLLSLLTRPQDGLRASMVVCPVTLIEAAWVKDLREWFPALPYVNLRDYRKGVDRERAFSNALDRHGHAVSLVNYETLRTDASVRRLAAGAYVVFDECSKLKAHDSEVTESVRALASVMRGCLLLSGTPAPNGNHEYWSLAKIIGPPSGYDAFPGGVSAFHREWCTKKNFGGYKFRPELTDQLHERLAPVCEWVKKAECLDLPAKVYDDVPIALTQATADAYAEMRELMSAAVTDRWGTGEQLRVNARNALSQVMRLRQITAGFVPARKEEWASGMGDAPQVMVPLGREKIDWLLERVELDPQRIVVWTQFIFEAARYVEELRRAKVSCEAITGQTDEKERPEVFRRFVAGDYQVLVAHPGVAQWGVSFPGVSLAAYGSASYSLQEYLQSQDRIHGIGRGDATKHSTYYRLAATVAGAPTIDAGVFAALDGKRDVLQLVFELDRERRAAGFEPRAVGERIDHE